MKASVINTNNACKNVPLRVWFYAPSFLHRNYILEEQKDGEKLHNRKGAVRRPVDLFRRDSSASVGRIVFKRHTFVLLLLVVLRWCACERFLSLPGVCLH